MLVFYVAVSKQNGDGTRSVKRLRGADFSLSQGWAELTENGSKWCDHNGTENSMHTDTRAVHHPLERNRQFKSE